MQARINIFRILLLITPILFLHEHIFPIDYDAIISQIDYKSNYPEINLYVSVIDPSGHPVSNMEQDEFIIDENGKLAAITKFKGGIAGSISTMLVIDRSGSMEEVGKMENAKEAAVRFVDLMRLEDKVGLIIFNNRVEKIQNFTSNKKLLTDKINPISPYGSTSFYDALYSAMDQLKDIGGRKGIIALTDGLDNESSHSYDEVIQYAETENIPIYTIGLGTRKASSNEAVDEKMLDNMAKHTGGRYFYAPEPEELIALYQQIARQIQNEYILTYNSPTPPYNVDKRKVVVTINHSEKSFNAIGSYNPTGFIYTPTYTNNQKQSANWIVFFILLIFLLFLLFLPKLIARFNISHLLPSSAKPEEIKITIHDKGKEPLQKSNKDENIDIVLINKESKPSPEQKETEEIKIVLTEESSKKVEEKEENK